MGRRGCVGAVLALSLIANALCVPTSILRIKRQSRDSSDSANAAAPTKADQDQSNAIGTSVDSFKDEDDDYEFPTYPADDASGGGSNVFSLLSLVTGLASGSSGSGDAIQKLLKSIVKSSKPKITIWPRSIKDDENDTDFIEGLKSPPLLRQETENGETENSESESNQSDDDNSSEENDEDRNKSDEAPGDEDFDDDDYDEPPGGGDGEGGGILGLLAGLSGGEDGQSDLGSLLATVSGIIANLSGDGIDLNALIASGIGLFVGLLSEGEQNPGEILASYLLTSLDTITGGGAQNNGAFFGKFLSKLLKGTSAGGDPDVDSDDNGNNVETKDSAGFFASFLMGLLGDMSKTSSGSHPMRRYFGNKPSFYTESRWN